MSARGLPAPWTGLVDREGSVDAAASRGPGMRQQWEAAAGADPDGLRLCALWCDSRAGEVEYVVDADGTLADRVRAVPGGAAAAEDLLTGLRALRGHAGALRDAAAALRAGADAVESVRERHEDALTTVAHAASAADDAAGGGRGVGGLEGGELRAFFAQSCRQSAAAMRRIDDVLADVLTAEAPHV